MENMRRINKSSLRALLFGLIALVSLSSFAQTDDPYLWLEGIDDEKALNWVGTTNSITDKNLASTPVYKEIYADTLSALNSQDKLPDIKIKGDWVYYLKKVADHPRGLYIRSTIKSFKSAEPEWQTVVDIDKMSAADGIKWVFHGLNCLSPEYEKCLMFLSPGGGDADEMREFNAKTLEFVENGFKLPKAKMQVAWMDADHLFVSTDFGEGSLTDSGYPRITKIWQRGESLESAKTVLEVPKESVSGYGVQLKSKSKTVDLLVDGLDFWSRQYYQIKDGKKHSLNLPISAVVKGLFGDQLVVSLLDDWSVKDSLYAQGSVVLVSPVSLWPNSKGQSVKLLLAPKQSAIIEQVDVTDNGILVTILEDVKSRIYRFTREQGHWIKKPIDLPKSGQLMVAASNDETGEFFARYEGFITPPTLYSIDSNLKVNVVLQQSPTFDASEMKVAQYFAESLDGTKVPYFAVMKNNTELNGKNPTHIFAYGGFRASLTPRYSGSYEPHNGAYGKAWLERGGVFVLANIRGGAEYGPAWHAAALLENRHKAFEDFEAVAEDLARRKITAAKHLGIEGRSNGGLLVGATMVRRPELYGAIICGVPLLDMLRYNKLLAGASWMAEYGNPDTDDWEFIKTYSPYQNVVDNRDYPPVFFFTSTRDDRVHPGHARKMAAKMLSQGHSVDYYENTEGGHKGSATAEQTAKRVALSFTHLWRHLK
ncbi:MAG: prolyl oligopeptidase [Cryomorphaceae bacterium]|jgi:prolyl oligopeptidase